MALMWVSPGGGNSLSSRGQCHITSHRCRWMEANNELFKLLSGLMILEKLNVCKLSFQNGVIGSL